MVTVKYSYIKNLPLKTGCGEIEFTVESLPPAPATDINITVKSPVVFNFAGV